MKIEKGNILNKKPPTGDLTYDVEGYDDIVSNESPSLTTHSEYFSATAQTETTLLSASVTCAQATVLHGFFGGGVAAWYAGRETYLRFYIDGVLQEESGRIDSDNNLYLYRFQYHKSVSSGARTVELKAYNADPSSTQFPRVIGSVAATCDKVV